MKRLLIFAVLIVALAANSFPVAQDASDDKKPAAVDEKAFTDEQKANVAVLDSILDTIRRRFYDRDHGGKDLKQLRAQYLKRAAEAKPGEDLHNVLREMLGTFKVSHLSVIEGEAYENHFAPEMDNSLRRQAGFDITELRPGEYFVTGILEGSAGDKAGIMRGDRVMKLNGAAPAESGLLVDAGGDPGLPNQHPHFFLRNPADNADLVVEVKREADAGETLSITIKPAEINMIRATANSVTIIEHEGRKFGYIRFWHFLHEDMAVALKKAIEDQWELCDGIIIDLRGRGGSPIVMNACFVPFGAPPPMRRGRRGPSVEYNMPKWERPVVALQDSGSRSAKEVYAHNWKWLNIGPVVGESTPGAVLGSNFSKLPDGSYLIYPAANVRNLAYGNVELEGNPVEPTHPVKDNVPYAAGVDTIKQAGIKILYDLVKDNPKPELPKPEKREVKEEEF
jgi:C-terminal processing protease CtpA/Prc